MRAPFSFFKSAGGGSPPFNPLSVSGCAVWYDAAHVTHGAGVTALPDQSGNSRDATVSGTLAYTATNAAYNNGPTINRADATDQILSPDLGLATGPFTFVFVGDAPTAAANFLIRLIGGGVGVDIRAQSSKYRASANGGSTELEDTVADTTVPVVLVVVYDGVSSRLYASALTPIAGDAGALPDLTGLGMYVGAPAADGFGDLNFRHALVYDGALSDADAAYLLTGFGAESGISIASFDRATLAATGYWLDFAGIPWVGTASAGTSLGHDITTTGADPTVGASFGAHPSADFSGGQYAYPSAFTFADIISTAAYSFHVAAELDALSAPAGPGVEYTDAALIADVIGGYLYVTVTSDGVRAGHYDGSAYHNTTPIPFSTGVKACVQTRFNGTQLQCRVNGLDSTGSAGWESVSVGHLTGSALADTPVLGASYAGLGKIDGREALVMTFDTALSDGDMDSLLADARANFGVP